MNGVLINQSYWFTLFVFSILTQCFGGVGFRGRITILIDWDNNTVEQVSFHFIFSYYFEWMMLLQTVDKPIYWPSLLLVYVSEGFVGEALFLIAW